MNMVELANGGQIYITTETVVSFTISQGRLSHSPKKNAHKQLDWMPAAVSTSHVLTATSAITNNCGSAIVGWYTFFRRTMHHPEHSPGGSCWLLFHGQGKLERLLLPTLNHFLPQLALMLHALKLGLNVLL